MADPRASAPAAARREKTTDSTRYSSVAIVLHWLIALAILSMIYMGWWMGDALHAHGAPDSVRHLGYDVIQIHKSIGLTILALSLVRLFWRLTHKAPPMPAEMSAPAKALAQGVHALFYVLMIAMPLSGWALVSSSKTGVATTWFRLFEIPHLPVPRTRPIHHLLENVHSKMAWVILGLLALHVAAALFHHFRLRDEVIPQMAPWTKRVDPGRKALLAGWVAPRVTTWIIGLVGLGAVAAFYVWTQSIIAERAPVPAPAAAAAAPSEPASTPAAPVAITPQNADAAAPHWTLDPAHSKLQFSGTHIGRAFTGGFGKFTADIAFAPEALAKSYARVDVDLTSARIGNPEYDGALPQSDWLDSAKVAAAQFATTRFIETGPGAYIAEGRLTLRGQTRDVRVPFTLKITGDQALMTGEAVLERLDFRIGAQNDAKAEWVSREITLKISLTAKKTG